MIEFNLNNALFNSLKDEACMYSDSTTYEPPSQTNESSIECNFIDNLDGLLKFDDTSFSEVASEKKNTRGRNKERTIKEVLKCLKEWRGNCDSNVKLYSLAEKIGVPKKTLDDYYSSCKLGCVFGFDFMSNLDKKIHVLRKFVNAKKSMQKQLKSKKTSEQKKKEATQFEELLQSFQVESDDINEC